MKYQEEGIKKIAESLGLTLERKMGLVSAEEVLKTSDESVWRKRLAPRPQGPLPFSDRHDYARPDARVYRYIQPMQPRNRIDKADIGVYIQPLVQNRMVHVEFMVPYNPADASEVGEMRSVEAKASRALNEAHAFFNRPYGTAEKIVFENNPTNTRLLKTVKGIFDPNRILNPGKFGL